MNLTQFSKYLKKRIENPLIVGSCNYCHKIINEQQASMNVPGGLYHKDCYWEAFGDLVEQHPIGAGRRGIRGSNLQESDLEVAV